MLLYTAEMERHAATAALRLASQASRWERTKGERDNTFFSSARHQALLSLPFHQIEGCLFANASWFPCGTQIAPLLL